MAFQPIPHQGPLLLAAVVAAGIGWYAWRHRPSPGARPLALVFFGVVVWSVCYAIQIGHTTGAAKLFWARLTYLGIVLVPAGWFLFALEFTGKNRWITRRSLAALSVEPILVLALVWTNGQSHDLILRSAEVVPRGTYQVLAVTFGTGFWVHVGYSYGLILVGGALVLRNVVVADDLYRAQGVALVLAMALPVAGTLLSIVVRPFGVDVTAISVLGAALLVTWAVVRHQFLRVAPLTGELARKTLVERLEDPVLAVDAGHRVAQYNRAAAEMLGPATDTVIGEPLADIAPDLASVVAFDDDGPRTATVDLDTTGRTRTYEVVTTPLSLGGGLPAGHVVRLDDVTEREHREQRLEVLNRLLRHNIRNDMTLIDGSADAIADLTDSTVVEEQARTIEATAGRLSERAERIRRVTQELERDKELPVDVARSVEYYVEQMNRIRPDATFDVTAPDTAPVAAGSAIELAIEELLQNAVVHATDRAPTVEVTVERDGSDLLVRIADDGPGIPEHERQVIESGSESPLEHGSGIGLWLANWVVESYGGDLTFDENDPTGTVVTLRVPGADAVPGERRHSPDGQPTE